MSISPDTAIDYQTRLTNEKAHFAKNVRLHELPPIYSYWAGKFLMPMFREFELSSIDAFFAKYLLESATRSASNLHSFVSIGSGNADAEIRIAKLLLESGLQSFTIDCIELNGAMIDRGKLAARDNGLQTFLKFVQADFNTWSPAKTYTAVMANQSLHHVLNLEGLFDGIKSSIERSGYFVTSDMIGRNGHQRWPEAFSLINEFWQQLPLRYRYNNLLRRQENSFQDFDCSTEGFEGIRAQDVLRLLVERFDFHLFLGFANIITPFIGRFFGHNFEPTGEWDRFFIDRVHAADEAGLQSGVLTPTQMLAVMSPAPCDRHFFSRGLSPEACIRDAELRE